MDKFVALYCRISKDRNGRTEGVRAQETWGRRYAADRWPDLPVRAFVDNDISAATETHRPGYAALRDAIGRGEVAHLWTVEQSRLERREAGWFTLAAELDAAGIAEVHTNRDGIVHVGGEVAGIKAVLAAAEVKRLRKRIGETLDERAREGRPSGGRAFGYRAGVDDKGRKTLVVDPAEAAIIRESADRVLAGWSLSHIAADLRARGVVGPHRRKVRDASGEPTGETRPGTITGSAVRSWLTSPTIAGRRVQRGEVVGSATWEPILSADVHQAVVAKLTAARTVRTVAGSEYAVTATGTRHAARRVYLLTGGVAVCGLCGVALVGSAKRMRDGRTVPYYECRARAGGCGRLGIMAAPVEELVVGQLLAELDKPGFLDTLGADDYATQRAALLDALAGVDGQRADLARLWSDRDLTAEEWRAARDGLGQREKRLRRLLADLPAPVERVDPALIGEGWDAMNLDERHEIVTMFIERVRVLPARPGAKAFEAARVAPIEWRRR